MNANKIMSLDDLCCNFSAKLKTGDKLIDHKHILEAYGGNDWKKYVNYTDNTYNRQLVINANMFDILVFSWKKDQSSKIHDHPNCGCLLKVVQGKLQEDVYDNQNKLLYSHSSVINCNQMAYQEGNNILHKIIALEDTVSIHIYSPPGYKPNFYNAT